MDASVDTLTTTTLLKGLFEPANDAVWREFDGRYRPILIAFAQKLGLGAADAADVAQETLVYFLRDYTAGKYDRQRGRLRAWIIGIARHRIAEQHRKHAGRRERRGDSVLGVLPDDAELTRLWDAEAHQAIVCRAMTELSRTSKLHPKTLDAFKMLVIEQRAPEEVAAALDISVRSVYLAKHRCLGRLSELLAELKAVYELE